MDTLFFWCALIGGTVLVCQCVMTLIGLGDGHPDFDASGAVHLDVDAGLAGDAGHGDSTGHAGGHDSTWFFGILTFRTLVVFSQFITHHLPELFSEPYRFRPERWESIDPSPYAYLPFAAGPKMCIGATLAMMTIRLTISTVWQRVRLAVMPGANINGKVTSTMLGPTTGMPMLVLAKHATYENHWVRGNIHELVELDWPVTSRRAA